MDPGQVPLHIQASKLLPQLKTLANEAIDLLYYDDLLPGDTLDTLVYRLQEYFTKELRALRKGALSTDIYVIR